MRTYLTYLPKVLTLLTSFLFIHGSAHATHIAGGNITYTKLANPNEYQITLTIYRDCNSIMQGPFTTSNMNMYYRNGCGQTYTLPVTWVPGTGIEVVTACTIDPSTCNGGTRYGLQEYKWTGTVTLPFSATTPTCNDWYFVWGTSVNAGWCCRNTNNTLGPAPGQQNFLSILTSTTTSQQAIPLLASTRFRSRRIAYRNR